MSVIKDSITITGNLTVLGFLNVTGTLTAGAIAATSITIGGNPIVAATPITNSLGADVNLNNSGLFFDGPSVAQGSTGTWFAVGTVTFVDPGASRNFNFKLWDGTNLINSAQVSTGGAGFVASVTLSGFRASPAGNLRISANEPGATTGKMLFNATGNSRDSTITAIRIG